jgi:ABC-2 type transport system permease protein
MNALLSLTRANLKSFVRDRAALFWTIAFPVIFIVLFGTLFSGGGSADYKIGWVDLDSSAESAQLRQAFDGVPVLTITPTDEEAGLASARDGSLDALIVVPQGFGQADADAAGAASPGQATITLYADPSDTTTTGTINQIVAGVLTGMNQQLSGRPPVLTVTTASIQGTTELNGASNFVPTSHAIPNIQRRVLKSMRHERKLA